MARGGREYSFYADLSEQNVARVIEHLRVIANVVPGAADGLVRHRA